MSKLLLTDIAAKLSNKDLLKILANHKSLDVRREVAKNPATEAETLHQLAQENKLRIYVSENPNTSEKTLRYLNQVGYGWTAMVHQNAPKEIVEDTLSRIYEEYSKNIKSYEFIKKLINLAKIPSLSTIIATFLLETNNFDVLENLAAYNTSPEILEAIFNKFFEVDVEDFEEDFDEAWFEIPVILEALLYNNNTPQYIIERLATSKIYKLRLAFLFDPRFDEKFQEKLSKEIWQACQAGTTHPDYDEDLYLIGRIADCECTSEKILEEIFEKYNDFGYGEILINLAENSKTPIKILMELKKHPRYGKNAEKNLKSRNKAVANSKEDSEILLKTAVDPNTDLETVIRLINSAVV